jgi:hypothetical protein
MRNLWKSVLGLCVIGMGLGVSAPAQADSVGPYYATPSWDQTLPAATRFIVLSNFASAAVLDRETGLVWEKVPSTNTGTWFDASFSCLNSNTGGRTGWRLPALPELMSLVDRSQANPSLPSGHPFTVQFSSSLSLYWSATSNGHDTTVAWAVFFGNGVVEGGDKSGVSVFLAWCVRGGPGVDAQ